MAACIGVGLYLAHKNQEFQNEMFRIVHSEEVKELIEEDLKRKDPNALTDKGKIRSYKIDDSSIKHNPMGGINTTIIVNDNPDLYIICVVKKKNQGYTVGGGVVSGALNKMVEGK